MKSTADDVDEMVKSHARPQIIEKYAAMPVFTDREAGTSNGANVVVNAWCSRLMTMYLTYHRHASIP